jgi:hypothetical protein
MTSSMVAGVLFIGLFAWFAVPQLAGTTDYLGRPPTGADKGTASTKVGTGVPTQREAESTHAKNDPVGAEDSTGGRARRIKESSQPVSLSKEQRDRLRIIFSSAGEPKTDHPNFEMMIGTSVPRQTELADLPPQAAEVLNSHAGSQYMIAGSDLVVVDRNSRRVAAIIADVR